MRTMTSQGHVADGGLMWLVNCLNATLDADPQIRTAAEEGLKQASLHTGYGIALAKVIVSKEMPLGLRQLAAVLLKQYVKQHWQEGEENFIPPAASSEDKQAIRDLLPQALEDPHGKIRTAVGMAIASIASWDWPEEWPGLMGYLLGLISDRNDANKVHGALRCLALFTDDLDDIQLPPLIPVLFPALYSIVSASEDYDPALRRRALILLHSCISTLGVMSGAYQKQTRALMLPMLKAWMGEIARILSPPVPSENTDDWGLRTEALKVLMRMVENFPKLVAAEFSVVLGPLWQTFVSCLNVYELASIQGTQDSYTGLADSDGSDQSLEAFVIQLFELLLTAVTSPRFSKMMQESIGELVYYTVGYMQMTEEQVQTWSSDPNQYVADEDDVTYSCRISGALLLEELVVIFEVDGLRLILEAVQHRLTEAAQSKVQGHVDWWKLREAAILAIGTVAGSLHKAKEEGLLMFNFEPFLDSLLNDDLRSAGVEECPFLRGRALWAAAKFSCQIDRERSEKFFRAAISGLADRVPAPIKVGACRALAELFSQVEPSVLQAHLGPVFVALGALLQESSDETLHLVLETLQAAVKADEQSATAAEANISPLILNVWANNIFDPFISIDALDTLQTIKKVPGCLHPLTMRVLPFLASILSNPHQQMPGLVVGALDLLSMLLEKAPVEIIRAAYDVSFSPLIQIALQSFDQSELQNATECLAAFVREGGEALLGWESNADHTMRMLLDVAARLLSPEVDSPSALFIGSFVTQLIMQLSGQMAPHIGDLIAALVSRMQSSESPALKNSLLLVFARLVHMAAPNTRQLLDLLMTVPAKDYKNALAYVMSEWVMHQGEIQGAYQIKVSTTALVLVLASGHPQLSQIHVQGRLIKSNTSGIVTRSHSKVAPDQFSKITLSAKLLSLLADSLLEMQEQTTIATTYNDDEWEEVEDDDGDEDVEEQAEAMVTKPSNGPSSVFQPLSDMQHLLTDEIEDGDYQEDPCAATDPLNQIVLSAYVTDFIKQFANRDKSTFHILCQELSADEQGAVQSALAR